MALSPELILRGAQQAVSPIGSLIGGIQTGQQLAGERQRQNLLAQQSGLQQQLQQQQLESGALEQQIMQKKLDALGVPTETDAKTFALNLAKLDALPTTEAKLAEIGRMKTIAKQANRTTGNLDSLEEAFRQDPAAGDQLLSAGVQAFERGGFLEAGTAADLQQKKLEQKERQLALEEQREKRQATKLSAVSEKALIESQTLATQAGQNATEFDILANQVRDAGLSGGLAASTTETFKQLLGSQDDVTELRRRFNKVRLSEGLKNLPPGPATDRDVKEAFRGVPPENAPSSQIESFLRGASKMAKFDQAWHEFRSEYISNNNNTKGLLKAWQAHAETISGDIIGDTAGGQKTGGQIMIDANGNRAMVYPDRTFEEL
jgi:hypothetical protein